MRSSAAILALLVAIAGPAVAQKHNSAAPIDFGAAHMELQDKQNRVILSGNVVIKQAEMTLTAARVTVAYTGQATSGSSQASRIDASGGVTVTRPNQTARGAYGIYDVNRRVVIMMGGVTLTQNTNTVSGSRLTINLDSGRAVIDGAGSVNPGNGSTPSTTSGGRVTGRFSVPKRDQPATK